jgi:hypothetical protein
VSGNIEALHNLIFDQVLSQMDTPEDYVGLQRVRHNLPGTGGTTCAVVFSLRFQVSSFVAGFSAKCSFPSWDTPT